MNYQYYEYESNNGMQNYSEGTSYTNTSGDSDYNPYMDPKKPKKPKKSHKGFGKAVAKFLAIAVVFGLVAGTAFAGGNYYASTKLEKEVEEELAVSEATGIKKSEGIIDSTAVSTATTVTDVSDIVDNVMPAIVQVTNMSIVEYRNWFGQHYATESESAGSGIIISQDSEYLYIVTNNHVVEGANTLTITFVDDSAVEAHLQGTDPNTDLAIVKVSLSDIDSATLKEIKVASIGSSDDLKVGSSAVVIGNALGYGQSVTTGVISALNREVSFQNNDGSTYSQALIQTDAAVNPGNSGGALLNMNGEVVGIVSAKYSDTEVEGMGYAIPISTASTVIETLMSAQTEEQVAENNEESTEDLTPSNGNSAYLGIMGVDVDAVNAVQYHMPQGVYVARVISGTGADKAGLQKKDVITGLNGTQVKSMEELQQQLSSLSAGDTVEVTVARYADDYAEETIQVTLSSAQ